MYTCKKYGCEFSFKESGEEFREVKDENGTRHTARFIIVEAEGTAKINGWKFVGSIEHTDKGNIISKICDDEVPEKYYTTEPICEHCHVKRYRAKTYLVRSEETGEFRQIGKNCLKDFTHGMSADAAAECMSWYDELIQGEAPYSGWYEESYLNTKSYLCYAAETIRHFGYRKSSDGPREEDTKNQALAFYNLDHGHLNSRCAERVQREKDRFGFDADSSKAVKMTDEALKWLKDQPESSNYMHNLKVACFLEYTKPLNAGLLSSLFAACNRDLERQAERAKEIESGKLSQYTGEIGDRVEVVIKDCRVVTSWETQFGTTVLYKITDPDGNVFIWKTVSAIPGNAVKIKGTVKEHKDYNGVKQTELTRCRVSESEKERPAPCVEIPYKGSVEEGLDLFMKQVNG